MVKWNKFATFVLLNKALMKYSKLISELIDAGCYLIRHGSRHDIWYSPITNKMFPIPRHDSKEVPNGTEKSIRTASGCKKK